MACGATEIHEGSTRASRVAVDALVNRVRGEASRTAVEATALPFGKHVDALLAAEQPVTVVLRLDVFDAEALGLLELIHLNLVVEMADPLRRATARRVLQTMVWSFIASMCATVMMSQLPVVVA